MEHRRIRHYQKAGTQCLGTDVGRYSNVAAAGIDKSDLQKDLDVNSVLRLGVNNLCL